MARPVQCATPEMKALDPSDWTPEKAEAIAATNGLGSLTADHWTVIAQCREDAARRGLTPCVRRLAELTGLRESRITRLFPGNPGALVARVAGLPLPPSRKET